MIIQMHADDSVEGSGEFNHQVETLLQDALGRFSEQIVQVEIYLNDTHHTGCAMTARLSGLLPIEVSHKEETYLQSIAGAADKLVRILDHKLSPAAAV